MAYFPFAPNWSGGVRATHSFRTEIITSRSGREQRRALRSTPRTILNYEPLFHEDQRRAYDRFLAVNQNALNTIPDWSRSAVTVAGTTTTFTLSELPHWLLVGRQVVWNDEVRTVSGVSGNIATVSSAFSAAVTPGSQIRPLVRGYLEDSVVVSMLTDELAASRVQFAIDPASEPPRGYGAAAVTLEGREVFSYLPNWSRPLDLRSIHGIEFADSGRGIIKPYRPVTFRSETRRAQFLASTQAEIAALLAPFFRALGRRGEFYAPTWADDMTLHTQANTGATSIVLTGRGLFDGYSGSTLAKAIEIRLRNGQRIFRTVTAISLDGAMNTTIALGSGLPQTVAPSDVALISWLYVCRFASDDLTVDYLSDSVAEVQMTFQTLEDFTPE